LALSVVPRLLRPGSSISCPGAFTISTLSLHDALPISYSVPGISCGHCKAAIEGELQGVAGVESAVVDVDARTVAVTGDLSEDAVDRKSTRLNSSHVKISYAAFCLKKKSTRAPPCRGSP